MRIKEGLEKFIVQLQADGRSPHTMAQYCRHVTLFAAWARDVGHSGEIGGVDHEHVAQFLASPTARTKASGGVKRATSCNCLRSSLRTFFRYCHEAGFTTNNPARLIRQALCGTPPPRGLSQAEQDRLLAILSDGAGFEQRRDHLLFYLMLHTGIRLGSTIGINIEDVDMERKELWLQKTKGNRSQRIILSRRISKHLKNFLDTTREGPLFTDRGGRRLSTRHVQRRFQLWAKRAGIRREVTVHSLRHSFGYRIYEKTHDLLLTKAALGNRSITSTIVYMPAGEDRLRQILSGQ